MIKSVKLEHFFSFGESQIVEINPDINILLGINGSGKSNFLKAIRLLYEGVAGIGFERLFLRDWGGFSTIANFNLEQADTIIIEYTFDKDTLNKINGEEGYKFPNDPIYEIKIHRSGSTSYYLEEYIYSIDPQSKAGNPFCFMKMNSGRGGISRRGNGKVQIQKYPDKESNVSFKEQELVLRQISDPNQFLPLFKLKTAIESIAVYDYFDTTLKSVIRQPASYGIDIRLLPTGENLVQILHRIKNHNSLDYENIENILGNINPNFKDINFDIIGSKVYLVLREKGLSKTVGVEHISDGTLRFLLLLSILYNPNRGSLICIDEPEIGLHPDMINTVAEAIKHASKTTQMIIATHNPLLLNAFELSDVLIFEKDKENKTVVLQRDEEEFEEDGNSYLVGQLWLNGKIGGKRW
ncbi:MAG: AAA family ATPase [Hyphomicrobiales bacterium]